MTQETHEALRLANDLDAYHTRAGHKQAATKMREMHALIVQIATAFEGERFMHDDQREAIAKAEEYLK